MKKIFLTACCLIVLVLLPSLLLAGASEVSKAEMPSDWPFAFDSGGLYCKQLEGGRKAVWINGSDGYTYAINGQAIDFFRKLGAHDPDGNPHRNARDYANKGLSPIIQKGLRLCP